MKSDIEKVQELGEDIGYGNMMNLACTLWRIKLKQTGVSETGAFVPVLSMDIKESEADFYLKPLKFHEQHVIGVLGKDKKPSIPEYLLNQPKKVEISGDEYEEVFMKFKDKQAIHTSSSLHVIHDVHMDEDGTKYHFYYPVDKPETNKPLIEKEINDTK